MKLERVNSAGDGLTHSLLSKKKCYQTIINGQMMNLNLTVNGKIDNRECLMLMDSASDISILNPKFFDKKSNSFKKVNQSITILTVARTNLIHHSIQNTTIQIGGISVNLDLVIADIQEDCILGLDFLYKSGLHSDLREILEEKLNSSSKARIVSVRETTVQPARIPNQSLPEHLTKLFELSSKFLNHSQKEKFANFLVNYQQSFSRGEGDLGRYQNTERNIILQHSQPIKQPPRRIPLQYRDKIYDIIEPMVKNKIIEPSVSSYASPATLNRKKDDSIRFCVDYRPVNFITKKDAIPLPRIEDIFDTTAGSKLFSTIDLKSGYWQIEMEPEAREITAFAIGNELWQFTVMPFGLCNAPATFIRVMNKVLRGLIGKICQVYLDDILIFGKNFEDLSHKNELVMNRLRDANLKVNPKKFIFFQPEVRFLGHVISGDGIKCDPEKTKAIINWPVPTTKVALQSFLGLCSYYRKYVEGFAMITKPLYRLTEIKNPYIWNEQCQAAFTELKSALISPPILTVAVPNLPFILDTDASQFSLGATLSQVHGNEEKVSAYFSRCLKPAQRNYCVSQDENCWLW